VTVAAALVAISVVIFELEMGEVQPLLLLLLRSPLSCLSWRRGGAAVAAVITAAVVKWLEGGGHTCGVIAVTVYRLEKREAGAAVAAAVIPAVIVFVKWLEGVGTTAAFSLPAI
jgi:hypothetical protein